MKQYSAIKKNTPNQKRNFLNLIKNSCRKTTAKFKFNDNKVEIFPLKIKTQGKHVCSHTSFFNIILKVLANLITKNNKRHILIRKEQIKISLFTKDKKKLMELINNYSKVAGYRLINKRQSISYILAINK